MGWPPAGPPLPADRVVARWISAVVPGAFLAVSLYLVSASGLRPESRVLLAQLGQYLEAERAPRIIGGDWSCAPRELGAWGRPERASGFA
eukprot:6476592-Pyramimonas_sp.AAC.1